MDANQEREIRRALRSALVAEAVETLTTSVAAMTDDWDPDDDPTLLALATKLDQAGRLLRQAALVMQVPPAPVSGPVLR